MSLYQGPFLPRRSYCTTYYSLLPFFYTYGSSRRWSNSNRPVSWFTGLKIWTSRAYHLMIRSPNTQYAAPVLSSNPQEHASAYRVSIVSSWIDRHGQVPRTDWRSTSLICPSIPICEWTQSGNPRPINACWHPGTQLITSELRVLTAERKRFQESEFSCKLG